MTRKAAKPSKKAKTSILDLNPKKSARGGGSEQVYYRITLENPSLTNRKG